MIQARARPGLESYCRDWIRTYLPDYTGMLNIETIGGRIIEAHLRFADQWPDLYGARLAQRRGAALPAPRLGFCRFRACRRL